MPLLFSGFVQQNLQRGTFLERFPHLHFKQQRRGKMIMERLLTRMIISISGFLYWQVKALYEVYLGINITEKVINLCCISLSND